MGVILRPDGTPVLNNITVPLRYGSVSLLLAVDKVEDPLVPGGRVGLVDRVLPPRPLVYPDLRLREHELACNCDGIKMLQQIFVWGHICHKI